MKICKRILCLLLVLCCVGSVSAAETAELVFVSATGTFTHQVPVGVTFRMPLKKDLSEDLIFEGWSTEEWAYMSPAEFLTAEFYPRNANYTISGDQTFYSVYSVSNPVTLDKTRYTLEGKAFEGPAAICGSEDYALTGQAQTTVLSNFSDVEFHEARKEFSTNAQEIRWDLHTTKAGISTFSQDGAFLAQKDGTLYVSTEKNDFARWTVEFDPAGSNVQNVAQPEYSLIFSDYGFIASLESGTVDLYRAEDFRKDIQYYTTQERPACPIQSFYDCPDLWYHDSVDFVVLNGMMNGVAADRFDPKGTLTRAMLATVLYRLAGEPRVSEPSTFWDIPQGEWYSDAVAWAQDAGIVNGVDPEHFAPKQNITREQTAAMLWRFRHKPAVSGDLSRFADAHLVTPYAQPAMEWAVSEGIFQGNPQNQLEPQGLARRSEFAVMLTRLLHGSYDCPEKP